MKTFKDNLSRVWTLTVDNFAVKRVRDLAAFDLLEVKDGQLFARLADDPVLLVDVLYAILKPRLDELKLTDLDFGPAMRGDCLEEAYHALVAEVIDFFPQALRREALTKIVSKSCSLANAMLERAAAAVDGLSIETLMQKLQSRPSQTDSTDRAAGSSSGNSPASPA